MAGNKPLAGSADLAPLLGTLRQLISDAHSRALRAVDVIQVQTCWQVGHHIVEFEQGGAARAVYGKRLLPLLAEQLTGEFGSGFDASNLRYMRLFYQAFPKRDALRHKLSWTHYRLLSKVQSIDARQWYMAEAAAQNWSTRALQRQIGTLFYERLLLSQDKAAVAAEAGKNLAALAQSPRAFVRDPVMLEFLGLPGNRALLDADRPENHRADPPGHRPDGYVCTHVRRLEARRWRQPHGGHFAVRGQRPVRGALFGAQWQRATVCQPLPTGFAE